MVFDSDEAMDHSRLSQRLALSQTFGEPFPPTPGSDQFDHFQKLATELLLGSKVRDAFQLDREDPKVLERYGDHLCGRSMLLARRLTEAGVPVVTVTCAAGDLNGAVGQRFDTHGNNFTRLKALLPIFDRPAAALLDDLDERGRLDETLVVFLTEFGRTPRINRGAGRDHYPNCYSVVLAGAGIQGGQVYGSSDRLGAEPASQPATPADLHATIFEALGIPIHTRLVDPAGRPFPIADGSPLPLFG